MADVIHDPFHRELAKWIDEEIESRGEGLIRGSASRVTEDTVTVAEKYAAAVAYIQALRTVLTMCQQIESGQHAQPRLASVTVRER